MKHVPALVDKGGAGRQRDEFSMGHVLSDRKSESWGSMNLLIYAL